MKKIVLILVTLFTLQVSAQDWNLEGVWKNEEGEILTMGWKTFERKTPTGTVSGTWEFEGENALRIFRSTGEEYVLPYSLTKTTWAIFRPFSDKAWIYNKIR